MVLLAVGMQGCGGDNSILKALDNRTPTSSAPVAVISGPAEARVKSPVTLDAQQSFDHNGNSLTYQWELAQRPNGSLAVLSSATAGSVTFFADKGGYYAVSLKAVNSASSVSPVTLKTVSVVGTGRNHPPVATFIATPSKGSAILDASQSYDADGGSLSYKWSFAAIESWTTSPVTGETTWTNMVIESRMSKIAYFYSAASGSYAIQLDVSDGVDSDTAINSVQVAQ